MKLSIASAITLLLAVSFRLIASSSLTEEAVTDSPIGPVSGLTWGQKDELNVLALDDETYEKVVDRADRFKVEKFIEIHELFKRENVASTVTRGEETFDLATAYVPCEIAWHLRIIEFDETIQCLEKSASWKARTKVGDKVLVNFFADKHAFELIQLLKTTDVDDEDLFLSIQRMLSFESFPTSASPAFFLRHALALHKQAPTSIERQEMVRNLLSMHLSAIATIFKNGQMIKELYAELVQDVPTLFAGRLPEHAIAVVATRTKEDEYDIVIVNSGLGIKNHKSTIEVKPKGFHTGASYGGVPTGESAKATLYNPLLRMKGVTGAQLASAHYHHGTEGQVYHVLKNESSLVAEEEHPMSWEWSESQGIGTCAATSVWFALHFYYQALGYESDIRLSMLDQAIGDLKELQDEVEGLERQMNADYQKAREAFRRTHRKTVYFPYDQDRVKDLKLEKDEAEKSLHLRRAIISMALNEILRNVIVWKHELDDINADLLTTDKEFAKREQRQKILEKAIPQTMASFHRFWALQEEKHRKKQGIVGTEAAPTSVLCAWHSIREDVRTMYNDAIRVTKIRPKFETALAKRAIVKQTFKPISIASLKEHSSLGKILGYIINFGDSPELQKAIREHLKRHTKNANAAKYLIVLYACLTRNMPLLDYLIVVQELPLLYTVDRTKEDTGTSMYWDLTTGDSIAALAAHEFAQYGQPLDAFPELFKKPQKETRSIVDKFKDTYKEIAPIINAKAPSQDDIDKAFEAFVEKGRLAVIAYTLPRTSQKAIGDAFIKADNVRVLRLLIDSVQDSKLLKQKIEANITNAKIVELVLPVYLRHQRRTMERGIMEKHRSGSTAISESAKVSLPDWWFKAAHAKNAVEVVDLLAPFANEEIIDSLLVAAARSGKSEMMQMLSKYAAADAVRAATKEAKRANKKQIEALFVEAAEEGDLDELEKWMPSVGTDIIGTALSKAAEEGEISCFARLLPHSTRESIDYALSKVSNENLEHPSVLSAVSSASKDSVFEKIIEGAIETADAELVARILPFMQVEQVGASIVKACKDDDGYDIVKHLYRFVDTSSIGRCLETLVKKRMDAQISLLLPRVERRMLAEISQSPVYKKLDYYIQQTIAMRIENFPTEIAIELAFLPDDKDDTRSTLQAELEKYRVESEKDETGSMWKDQQSCIDLGKMDSSALVFPIEQAIGRLLGRKGDNVALEKLLPFATPHACARIMSTFAKHGSEKAVKACAEKVPKSSVLPAALSAQEGKNFELVKFLVPLLTPLGIVVLLEPSASSKQVDAVRLEAILSALPTVLADDALRIAVRGSKEAREKSVHDLLPKASQAAIDEAYLFAKRIEFDDGPLEKAASDTAKAQGAEIEEARWIK